MLGCGAGARAGCMDRDGAVSQNPKNSDIQSKDDFFANIAM